ncbi:MAG: hypothetical protein KC776_21325 [Myxococcales bacterium]|nr:hypothetical protein [Myxococcales bacterium]MCB9581498.1 hypothetical protein [Polyangiaceae bacterium]
MSQLQRIRRLSERKDEEYELRVREAKHTTPSERLTQALELSDIARELAKSVGAAWVTSPPADLGEKARRYPVGR